MPLGIGTYYPVSVSIRDKGGEIGTFNAYGLEWDETTWVAQKALADAFFDKINGVTLGLFVKTVYGVEDILNPVGLPASASAQRENKLLVRYHDAVTSKILTATIPTIDLPNLVFLTEAKDKVDMTTPLAISSLKTAWEDFIVNPETGNLTIIDSLEFVGRNT